MTVNAPTTPPALIRAPLAVFLAWLLPGLGHIYLGHRTRGIVLLVTVTLTFWTGVAIGGAKTVSRQRPPIAEIAPVVQGYGPDGPREANRSWWFYGQALIGGYVAGGLVLNRVTDDFNVSGMPRYLAWPSADLANVYTGVAGLLNLLIILDVMGRADAGPAAGRPRAGPGPGRGAS